MNSEKDLKLSSYDYCLETEQIARRPIIGRHNSKLMVFNRTTNEVIHSNFHNISDFIPKDSLLVLNKSKVFPCRLIGKKSTGGQCEVFLTSLNKNKKGFPALIKTTNTKRQGDKYFFDGGLTAVLKEIGPDGSFWVDFNTDNIVEKLEQVGQVPLPPYIRSGESDQRDKSDYQTIYAKDIGSVAAPTAGLHFSDEVFHSLTKRGVEKAFVTLHVGPGTFKPVKTENIDNHRMHSEQYFVGAKDLRDIKDAKERGKKIFAVGTTSLRVLESVKAFDSIKPNEIYNTDIFLYPGKEIHSVDGLITNFHLPKSSLLMLVSALIGREKVFELYQLAKENNYRFYSYGDAMLIIGMFSG